jgi:peptide/nickel transport system substrate-binding protein
MPAGKPIPNNQIKNFQTVEERIMRRDDKTIDAIRRHLTEIENDLADEFLAGRIGRREFLRHGSVLGLSLPVMSGLLGALGMPLMARPAHAAAGATVRVACWTPAGAIDPVTIADNGGLLMLHQTGEFLSVSDANLRLVPRLAESWKPNEDGTVWTFAIRKGVKFHNGKTLTAADVVATIDRLADPANSSNALSAFKGTLAKGATRKVDDYTVAFHLDAPNGNFPYLVSSDNYNAIILPADYAGDFESNFVGTGPFKLEKYTPKVGASFVRNTDYWGEKALPDRTVWNFYDNVQAMVLALQGGQVDLLSQVPVQGAQALLNDPTLQVMSERTCAHQQVHMRTDMAPFTDKRVRQAIALCLNRANLVKGLFMGRGTVGNDNPFAPVFPSTDTTVPQRQQDIAKAKQLMEAAGHPNGFTVKLTTERYLEIPDYAVLIQDAVKAIGVTIDLNVEPQDAYYGKAVFGQSDWLDSIMGITDYGHRGVPNVLLSAPLLSDGTWNAAHFKNKEYDSLVAQYIKALDLNAQRATAGKIQRLLLDETPIIVGYFYDYLTPAKKNLAGIPLTANRLFLSKAHFT